MFRISFFVEDKALAAALRGVAGSARDLSVVPVVNAVVDDSGKSNGRLKQEAGSNIELIEKHLRARKIDNFPIDVLRSAVQQCGFSVTSYSHFANMLLKARILKRVKNGQSFTYSWVKP